MPTLEIQPVNLSTMHIPVEYYHTETKTRFALDENGKVRTNEAINRNKLKRIILHSNNPRYVLTWKDGDATAEAEASFWLSHELVKLAHGRNKNCKQELFVLIMPDEIRSHQYDTLKQKGAIYNYVAQIESNVEELRNIAYYYGMTPKEVSPQQIFISLVDFQTGILMRPENVNNFLSDYKKDNQEIRLRTIVKKAIATNVFELRSGIYFFESNPIGSTEESLIVYCKENKDIYEKIVVPEVSRRDIYVKKEKPAMTADQIINGNPVEDVAERSRLRDIAKTQKWPSTHNMSLELARIRVKEGEAIHARAKELHVDLTKCDWMADIQYAIDRAEKKLANATA